MTVTMLFNFTDITLERLLSIKGNFRLLTINSFESSLKCIAAVLENTDYLPKIFLSLTNEK